MSNQWAIMDDNGVICQDTEEKIRAIWGKRHNSLYLETIEPPVKGDLRLIEIHEVDKKWN